MGYGANGNDTNKNENTEQQDTTQAKPEQPQPQQFDQTPPHQTKARKEGVNMGQKQTGNNRNIMEMLGNPAAWAGRGERTHSSDSRAVAFRNAFRTKYEELKKDTSVILDVDFAIYDGDFVNGQNLSSIIAYAKIETNNGVVTVIRPMLVSVKRDRRSSRTANYSNIQVTVDQRPQDLAAGNYYSKVADYIARNVPNVGSVRSAGILELPVSLDPTDEEAIANILIDNEQRLYDAVSTAKDESRITLQALAQTQAQLAITPVYGRNTTHTVTGRPVRSDVTVSLNANFRINQQQGGYQGNQQDNTASVELNSLSGFIDLVPFRAPMQSPIGITNPLDMQCFNAYFVITNARQGDVSKPNQMESFLLSLAQMYYITANGSWLQAFAPTFGEGRNTNDPTAMGYWIASKRFSDNGKDITDMGVIQQLLKTYLTGNPTSPVPALGFMMDINPTGENAALELPLLEIALQTPKAEQAAKYIIEAMNNLTGGRFTSVYNPTGPMVKFTGDLVSLGEYVGQDGQKRDVRDMGYLPMLNLTDGNQEDFRQWFDTTKPSNTPQELLRIRESVEKRYLGTSCEFDGYAYRVQFDAEFVTAVYKAIVGCGVSIVVQDNGAQNQQAYFGNPALTAGMVNGMASSGWVNTNQNGAFNMNQNLYGGQSTYY